MAVTLRCPNCQQELLLGDARTAQATVCPRCFQVVTLSVQTSEQSDTENFDFLEEALRPTSPGDSGDSAGASSAAKPTLNASISPSALPTPVSNETAMQGKELPAGEAHTPSPGQTMPEGRPGPKQPSPIFATLIGCGVPLLVLVVVLGLAVWYVLRYTASNTGHEENAPPVTRVPLEKFFQ